MRSIVLSVAVVVGFAGPLAAREVGGGGSALAGWENAPENELAPVAVPRPSAVALRYYETGNWIWAGSQFYHLAIPAILLFSGFSARLRTRAQRVGRSWFFTTVLYIALYTVVVFLINIPWEYYVGFTRQHAYGLSRQGLGRWLGNALKGLAISVLSGVAFGWIPFYVIKRSPKRWWLYLTVLAIPFAFFVALVSPVLIDPVFNHYGPLEDQGLEAKIQAQARRAGIEGTRIYQVNKSLDTKALNAYVKGVLDTKRIVLYDTLLDTLNDREVLAVLGHEMGHYVLGHVPRGIVLSSVLVLAGLFWVDRAGRRLIVRYRDRFGFDRLSDVAAVPLILLLMQLSALAMSPLAFAFSRYQEHEADRFALELTRTNHSAAEAFVKLQRENLSNPRPGLFYKVLRATHPSIGDRIDFCNMYHPWTKGEPLVYDGLFRRGPE